MYLVLLIEGEWEAAFYHPEPRTSGPRSAPGRPLTATVILFVEGHVPTPRLRFAQTSAFQGLFFFSCPKNRGGCQLSSLS